MTTGNDKRHRFEPQTRQWHRANFRSGTTARWLAASLPALWIFLLVAAVAHAVPVSSRNWEVFTPISGGALTAPTMAALVLPGATINSTVSTATDVDRYMGSSWGSYYYENDTITYSWSSDNQGTFASSISASTTWTAPTTPGEYTLICNINDMAQMASTDGGTRDDSPLMRFVTVTVVSPPGAPTFSDVDLTSLTVTMPQLPTYATSMSLQQKLTADPDTSYATIAANLTDFDEVPITGLTTNVSYTFRAVAVYSVGSVPGTGASVTPGTAIPGAPDAPTFSNLTPTTVDVTAPALPVNAVSMTLQGKVAGNADSTYINIWQGITGYQTITSYGLDPGGSYTYRYMAVGVAGSTPGTAASVTLPTRSVSWSVGSAIACGGIYYPATGATIVAGAEGRFSAYLATDWDGRDVTIDGVTTQGTFSDPCSYTWSANGGTAKNGINSGQSFVWIAPTTPGTYTITLTVDDQSSGNKPSAEAGTRNDTGMTGFPDVPGFNDDAVDFTIEVTVVAP